MPSTHKTPFLKLNQWLGTDKPKREDFCSDNLSIDNSLKGHILNAIVHITADERILWQSGAFTVGSYVGNMTASRTIELGYRPRFVLLFTVGRPLCEYRAAVDTNNVYSAAYTPLGGTLGIDAGTTGFTVQNAQGSVMAGSTSVLNQNGKVYMYAVWR